MGGSLTEEEIRNVRNKPNYSAVNTFIEAGTYKGVSSRLASKFFDIVHTIEIVPELYQQAREIAFTEGKYNIIHHLGDTVKILDEILTTGPCIYFLDSHQSGPDTGNNGKWVPLFEELKVIMEKGDDLIGSIIIVDDVRLFSQHWDWEGISVEKILEVIGGKYTVKEYTVENDRLFVYL